MPRPNLKNTAGMVLPSPAVPNIMVLSLGNTV